MQLHPTAIAAGASVIAHEVVGSTNTEALALARCGERGPLWITAERQTAGRGRRGNLWVSQQGNLHATLLLRSVPPARAGQLAFVAALAVHDALLGMAPQAAPRLTFKWPNDLLVDHKKFCGILVEMEQDAAVIGIGVNCAYHPHDTVFPATDLRCAGLSIAAAELFQMLSKTMLDRLRQWDNGAGFAALRADWLAHARGVGQEIRVRLPTEELHGCFETLDETGRLLLRLSDGRVQAISAGEVFALASAQTAAVR
ncbi:MAG TPA: biotin--[acetyl-CoA-carboxylase] ligase [Xanthobacteraceae bacterium]|nr:biotin--[acetyl-CoA-carboxylase] ligase [Xanthobacteraceae bacterium]